MLHKLLKRLGLIKVEPKPTLLYGSVDVLKMLEESRKDERRLDKAFLWHPDSE